MSDLVKAQILEFVDLEVPPGTTEVWLTGSRAVGAHHPDGDWDVVAFHPDAPSDSKKLFCPNRVEEIEPRFPIELVIAHPDHKNEPRRCMTDSRNFVIRLR